MDSLLPDNIIQSAGLQGEYASLHGSISSQLRCSGPARLLWTVLVRKLAATRNHEDWIEKWTFNALIHGLESDAQDRVLLPCPAKANSLALFTDFFWYLLSNNELKAVEILNDCRSNLNLAMLPSGFKATDLVVKFNRTPADTSTLLDNNSELTGDHAMRETFRNHSQDRLPSSPLTELEELECTSALLPLKPSKQEQSSKHTPLSLPAVSVRDSDVDEDLPSIVVPRDPLRPSGPVSAADSDIDEDLPSIIIHRVRRTVLAGGHLQPEAVSQCQSVQSQISSNAVESTLATSSPVKSKGRKISGKKQHSGKKCKIKFLPYPKKSSVAVSENKSLLVESSVDELAKSPTTEDIDMDVQLDFSEEFTLSKRKCAKRHNVNLENEHPRQKPVVTFTLVNEEEVTVPVPNESAATRADALSSVAQEHENFSQHDTGAKTKGQDGSGQFYNSGDFVNHLCQPLAQRRQSRGAAAKASGMIQSQYIKYPVHNTKHTNVRAKGQKRAVVNAITPEKTTSVPSTISRKKGASKKRPIEDSQVPISPACSGKRMKGIKKSHVYTPEQTAVDITLSGESTSLRVEGETLEPKDGEDVGVGTGKLRRGSKREKKTKEKKKKNGKDIEVPISTADSSSSHLTVDGSSTLVSSPTAVASSSSSTTAFSSPLPTEVPPSAKRCLPSDQDSIHHVIRENVYMDNSTSTQLPSSSEKICHFERSNLTSQDEDQVDYSRIQSDQQSVVPVVVSQLNQAVSQPSTEALHDHGYERIPPYDNSFAYFQSSEVFRAPWSVSRDETNYSNNSRPPGTNDTHFWSTASQAQSPRVNFPPLQGDSLSSDNQVSKPKLPHPPPVWSHSRQELCESLSYFRAYQGGVYTHKQRAEGYLLDGYPARYDLWHSDGRYIISHGGGHSALDRLTGRVSLVEDQVADVGSCAALISSWKAAHAIVLIAGSGYKLFPYSLDNMNYVVLGYYHIIHAWEEPEPSPVNSRGYCVRWKFLFRWIDAQGSPWWLSGSDRPKTMNPPLPATVCEACGRHSCHIFGYGWTCTNSNCRAFYKLSDKSSITTEGYSPAFLTPREDPPEVRALKLDIRPKPPVHPVMSEDTEQPQITTSRHFWKGFWCEKCGKLSCREFWTYWKCSNCDHTLAIKAIIQLPPKINSVKSERFVAPEAGIIETTSRLGGETDPYECHTFTLPFSRGRIHLIKASGQSLQLAGRIFRQYQLDASNDESFFRRYSMKTHKLKGRMLSHYFSQNSGEPYAYVGGTNNTVDLYKYKSVTKALDYIRGRATMALKFNPEFNEVLSAGYMEEQKMEFHSDGEKDLGPVVASLSLGSPAIMKFRPVPSKWVSDDGQLKEGRKTPPVVIELTLRHGDTLVMEGAEIQEYYQVSQRREC